jgi:L-Ala-D/L-Glu epimerase
MRNIISVKVDECSYPLIKPYQLSFVTLNEFQTIRLTISLNNLESRLAEVVPLEGYSDESYENVFQRINACAKGLEGLSLDLAREKIIGQLHDKPFSSTAILTAIDLFDFEPIDKSEADKLATLKPFSTSQLLSDDIKYDWFEEGQSYKMKLSGDLSEDKASLDKLNLIVDQVNCSIRVDANQAYNFEGACALLEAFHKNVYGTKVEYFEQLLDANDWEGQEKLVSLFPDIEFMLDEPIVDHLTIDRAKAIGVNYVKLKLYKQGGIVELISHAKYAHQLGLKVILGNGVATWASNQVELAVYETNKSWFSGVHEANGYLKIVE